MIPISRIIPNDSNGKFISLLLCTGRLDGSKGVHSVQEAEVLCFTFVRSAGVTSKEVSAC